MLEAMNQELPVPTAGEEYQLTSHLKTLLPHPQGLNVEMEHQAAGNLEIAQCHRPTQKLPQL